jgi:hypothetical protein
MFRTVVVAAATLVFAVTFARTASAQVVDSCGAGCPKPPKSARAVAAAPVLLAAYPGNTLSATLAKGKKKTILMADGILSDGSDSKLVPREYDLGISVNGLSMQPASLAGPGNPEADEDCGVFRTDPDRTCTVVGHWWLDMDDPANAALLGVPITVTLAGGDVSGGLAVGSAVEISLRVRLEKK